MWSHAQLLEPAGKILGYGRACVFLAVHKDTVYYKTSDALRNIMDENFSILLRLYDHCGLASTYGYHLISGHRTNCLPSNDGLPNDSKFGFGLMFDFMRLSKCSIIATKMEYFGYVSSVQIPWDPDTHLWDDAMYSDLHAAISEETENSSAGEDDL